MCPIVFSLEMQIQDVVRPYQMEAFESVRFSYSVRIERALRVRYLGVSSWPARKLRWQVQTRYVRVRTTHFLFCFLCTSLTLASIYCSSRSLPVNFTLKKDKRKWKKKKVAEGHLLKIIAKRAKRLRYYYGTVKHMRVLRKRNLHEEIKQENYKSPMLA